MSYPKTDEIKKLATRIQCYAQLKHEYGSPGIEVIVKRVIRGMERELRKLKSLPASKDVQSREPNSLPAIRRLRPAGPRRLWPSFDASAYADRLEGALLGRFAGCTLGAPVEFWPVEKMENLARELGMSFPPTDYWTYATEPFMLRYGVSLREAYTRKKINGVPADDDIAYTLLGLLVVEEYGPWFTVAQNGKAWRTHLPYACTAESVALENLNRGVPASKVGETNNPYCQWIGADIRSDPWAYMAPGYPEFAAEMAYRDACLSHRRNGIYGEMYFAATISTAFAVDDPVEALRIGLTEIPRNCALAKAVRWALKEAPKIRNYEQARAAVEKKFRGMNDVHTINNACLTIWGITIGKRDFSRVIGETVAMGMDNDCTAATAGSIVGAVVGKDGIDRKWTRGFNNVVYNYFKKHKKFRIDDLLRRFALQAKRIHAET
jgi:ADP-ribosylglycohydrolase